MQLLFLCHASSTIITVVLLRWLFFFLDLAVKGLLLRKSAVPHSQKGRAQEMEENKVFKIVGLVFRLTPVTGLRPCNMKLIIKQVVRSDKFIISQNNSTIYVYKYEKRYIST